MQSSPCPRVAAAKAPKGPTKPQPAPGKKAPPLKPFPPPTNTAPVREAKSLIPSSEAPVAVPKPGEPGGSEPHGTPHLHHTNVPYIPANQSLPEVTLKAVVLGMILSVILGAANTYLGLKAGITVAAAIPAAVVSLGVLRMFRKHNILENNMVQTIASAGSAVASGILFTIPALWILGHWEHIHYVETTLIGVVGGLLGVFFTVPLRRALIVEENLAFPEGVATAEVLKSGETGGSGLGALLVGGLMGATFKFVSSGINMFAESTLSVWRMGRDALQGFGADLSAALVGVGYIVGLRIASLVFIGGGFVWLVAIPVITGTFANADLVGGIPSTDPACIDATKAMAPLEKVSGCVYKYHARYLGVGAMLVGGLWSLIKLRKPLVRAVTHGLRKARGAQSKEAAAAVPRTEVELSARTTFLGIAFLMVPMFFFYAWVTAPAGTGFELAGWNWGVAAVMAVIMAVTGFLFSAVGAYMAGLVGSSNNPISGVTILTLMVSAFSLQFLGVDSMVGPAATIFVAGIIAVGGSIASDNLQDLKAGYMLGATPRKQQAMIAIGAVVSAFFIAPVLQILLEGDVQKYGADGGFGSATLPSAQSNLMAAVSGGIFDPAKAGLPYPIIGIGMLLAVILIVADLIQQRRGAKFRVPVMAVAVGMYLPIGTSTPIFFGGLIAFVAGWIFHKRTGAEMPEGSNPGILFASGLIAGEALMGILTSALASAGITLRTPMAEHLEWPGAVLLAYIGFVMGYVALRKVWRKAA